MNRKFTWRQVLNLTSPQQNDKTAALLNLSDSQNYTLQMSADQVWRTREVLAMCQVPLSLLSTAAPLASPQWLEGGRYYNPYFTEEEMGTAG